MRKKGDLPTTTELECLINNLKLNQPYPSSPSEVKGKDRYGSVGRQGKEVDEQQSRLQSIIEDDFSSYKCFQQLEREYLQECKQWQAKQLQRNKVVLSSPIYRLDPEDRLTSPIKQRAAKRPPNEGRTHMQPTFSTSSKQRMGKSKECNVRKRLFDQKENSYTASNIQPCKEKVEKSREQHKFSNCQQFIRWK